MNFTNDDENKSKIRLYTAIVVLINKGEKDLLDDEVISYLIRI